MGAQLQASSLAQQLTAEVIVGMSNASTNVCYSTSFLAVDCWYNEPEYQQQPVNGARAYNHFSSNTIFTVQDLQESLSQSSNLKGHFVACLCA